MKAILLLVLAAWPMAVAAQDAEEGAGLYMQRCASCHGAEARGNGPMAPVLLVQPTDLTQLAAGNDAAFPMLRVIRRIDGRDPLVSHGSDMPVYGELFEGDDTALKLPSGQLVMTSRPIADLIVFLQAIQD
ncbi:c-type cytochrome [Lutimaribacter sp. EGI FJ00015]|uniref:C-type cytochrome n=1 Tax=Lutimaribacter degradans TaxID=2945989 RepID=A0ACC6A0F9_9RHOB|nr:cytochrome c [Lutimaribacter sp. EGI FJ00013]MCM2563836.1 c-type cytochrome [Lutimaribacter sp. EGI FJ00013]MCO0615009.1 c-type cytochrome [Lutimaribacter sp. EGI FJ00015]MCO0637673.1 c-type cytochrome [Lutimaribacter sp. EGI FJ00014]